MRAIQARRQTPRVRNPSAYASAFTGVTSTRSKSTGVTGVTGAKRILSMFCILVPLVPLVPNAIYAYLLSNGACDRSGEATIESVAIL